MDLEKYKEYLFIFRSTEFADHYLLIYTSESKANHIFESSTRTGPKYGMAPADGIPWGFPYIPMEKVLQLDADEPFVNYIKQHIAVYANDDKKNHGDWGWYIIKEIDTEKWMASYQAKLSEQRNKLKEAIGSEKKAEQIKMF
jgi:hypothetical protein